MANGEVTTGKVIALIRALSTSSTSSATYTVTDALVIGAATTSGVRLDLESGTLAVREGDDSDYGQIRAQGAYRSGGAFQIGSDNSNRAQISDLAGANVYWNFTSTVFQGGSSTVHNWTASTATAAADTGLARDSAGQVVVTDGSTGVGNLRATALIVGTADTSGVRLDLESGALAVREGDDSGYAQLKCDLVVVNSKGTGVGLTGAGSDAWCTTGLGPYQGHYTATSNPLSALSSGRLITNDTATANIECLLPAAISNVCISFHAYVASNYYIRLTAASGDTIRDGATVSAAGGYIRSTDVGASLLIMCVNATEWVVFHKTGTWTIDS